MERMGRLPVTEMKESDEHCSDVEATLNYILDDGAKFITTTVAPDGHESRSGGGLDPRPVILYDGRRRAQEFSLEREGFRFVRHDTKVADFYDEEEIRRVYYPEMEALLRKESGAQRVLVFDHVLRMSGGLPDSRAPSNLQRPIKGVHNDFTEWSAAQRLHDLLPDEADNLQRNRFAILQIWRPISHAVEIDPFAIADAQSLSPDNLVVSERRNRGRVTQTYGMTYSQAHKWFWFPRMRPEEALVFKAYDSLKDGRARWTVHTAFNVPGSPAQARPRESIEIRTLALF